MDLVLPWCAVSSMRWAARQHGQSAPARAAHAATHRYRGLPVCSGRRPLAAALWCLPEVADLTASHHPGEIAKDPLGMLKNNLQQMSDQRVAQERTHAYGY